MKKILFFLVTAALMLVMAVTVNAAVLDFEDLPGSDPTPVPDPYHSLIDWEDNTWFYGTLPPHNPNSGVITVSSFDTDANPSWSFLTDVVYEGSYFSGFDIADVQIDLYKSGILVHSTDFFTLSEPSTFFPTGYSGLVDAVTINTSQPGYWTMDDLTYVVPEPTTLAFLTSGLIGLSGFLKRKP